MKTNAGRPTFDADGYPTEETELAIKAWDFRDVTGWLEYIREAWNHSYGRMWEESGKLKLATGGWSGNEAITHAMRENYILWSMLWESSHRGGLEVLRIPNAECSPDERLEFLRAGPTETLLELLKEIVMPMELGCSRNFFLLAMDRRFRTTRPEELFDLIVAALRERVPSASAPNDQ